MAAARGVDEEDAVAGGTLGRFGGGNTSYTRHEEVSPAKLLKAESKSANPSPPAVGTEDGWCLGGGRTVRLSIFGLFGLLKGSTGGGMASLQKANRSPLKEVLP